jgi:hypothetical protein
MSGGPSQDRLDPPTGKPPVLFHGTATTFQKFTEGPSFFTSSPAVANGYRRRKLVENSDIELPEDVSSVDELGAIGIEEIAREHSLDLSGGEVLAVQISPRKTLDLRHLEANFSPTTEWDDLFELGLVECAWKDLDEEAQWEVKDEYGNKAIWRFLDAELHSTIAREQYDCVVFNDVDMGGKPHETWAVYRPEVIDILPDAENPLKKSAALARARDTQAIAVASAVPQIAG